MFNSIINLYKSLVKTEARKLYRSYVPDFISSNVILKTMNYEYTTINLFSDRFIVNQSKLTLTIRYKCLNTFHNNNKIIAFIDITVYFINV